MDFAIWSAKTNPVFRSFIELAEGEDYRLYRFRNCYGLSIVRKAAHTMSNAQTWEVAIVHFYGRQPECWNFTDKRNMPCRDKAVEVQILGYQSARDIRQLARQVAALPGLGDCE